MKKPIVIGIMLQEQIRQRVLAIARGDYKPAPGEPKVWFTSMKSLAEVLSDENHTLLRTWSGRPSFGSLPPRKGH